MSTRNAVSIAGALALAVWLALRVLDATGAGGAGSPAAPGGAPRSDGSVPRDEPTAPAEMHDRDALGPPDARAVAGSPGSAIPAEPAVPASAGPPTRLVVRDGGSGQALAGFPLTVVQEFTKQLVVTDTEGIAVLEEDFVDGPIRLVFRGDRAPAEFRRSLTVEPEVLALTPGRDHFVTIRQPARMLRVELVAADGSRAAGATALLGIDPSGPFDGRTAARWPDVGRRRGSDADGAAEFPLHRDEPSRRLLLAATPRGGGAECAVPVLLTPPHSLGTHRVRYRPSGRVRIRVLDADGAAIEGAGIRLENDWPHWACGDRSVQTDARGEALARGLLPGPWTITRVKHGVGDLLPEPRTVEVPEGDEVLVELRATRDVPRPLAAGRVVRHDGEPEEDFVLYACGPFGVLDAEYGGVEGRFVLDGTTAEREVELICFQRETGAPARGCPLRVPAGSEDLVLRLPDPAGAVRVTFVLTDAEAGGPIPPKAVARVFVHGSSEWSSQVRAASTHLVMGSGRLTLRLHREGGLAWTAGAFGYRDVSGSLGDLSSGASQRLDVEMIRGFARRVRVLDEETREPVAGVRFADATGAQLGSTDLAGWADLECEHWPTEPRALHPDYEPAPLRVNAKFDTQLPLMLSRRR